MGGRSRHPQPHVHPQNCRESRAALDAPEVRADVQAGLVYWLSPVFFLGMGDLSYRYYLLAEVIYGFSGNPIFNLTVVQSN